MYGLNQFVYNWNHQRIYTVHWLDTLLSLFVRKKIKKNYKFHIAVIVVALRVDLRTLKIWNWSSQLSVSHHKRWHMMEALRDRFVLFFLSIVCVAYNQFWTFQLLCDSFVITFFLPKTNPIVFLNRNYNLILFKFQLFSKTHATTIITMTL